MHQTDGFCDCTEDGFCQRYGREMRGRFRDICRGVNVDLGTAATFREQWAHEAKDKLPVVSNHQTTNQKCLLLRADQAPGDMVAMTAAIYSLHRAHPGKYLTAVECLYPEVFTFNPDVVPLSSLKEPAPLHMHYNAIHMCNERAIHFMQGWCEHISAALGIAVPLLTNHPRLYFIDPDPPTEDFWLICSGGKQDFTAKLWGHNNYQEVVSSLKGSIRFVQVGNEKHNHLRLQGVEYAVGKTTLRGLFELCRRARGVLCGVSLLMHVAAALQKPAIVVAGGREPVSWNAYPRQQYVHTVGALSCRSTQGHVGEACWRSRVVPLGDETVWDHDTCEHPVDGIPLCMRMIAPSDIVSLVFRYNQQWENGST